MITRRAFIAHLAASGLYARAVAAAPRLGATTDGRATTDAPLVDSVDAFVADQTWRTTPVVAGGSLDLAVDQDVFLQFGDASVAKFATPSTALYYPAAPFGSEPVGVPSWATQVAVRAVQASANVEVMNLTTPIAYGGANVSLRFDAQTAYSLMLPAPLSPPFTMICRFRSAALNVVNVLCALGTWGTSASQRSLRIAGRGRAQVTESSQGGAQNSVVVPGWAHNPGGASPLWSLLGGSWRPSGTPGKGCYAHNSWGRVVSLADNIDPTGTKGAPATELIVGGDSRGELRLSGLVDWILVVAHELSEAEWIALERINVSTSIWPPDLFADAVAFIPVQAGAPLVDVMSGRDLTLRSGAFGTHPNVGTSNLKLPSQVDASVVIPYGDVASTPILLPAPNKGLWRAQAHHDVRISLDGTPANASSRLIGTGTSIVPLYGAWSDISVVADNPAHAGALNLTALL
jgi:hypothetical protein